MTASFMEHRLGRKVARVGHGIFSSPWSNTLLLIQIQNVKSLWAQKDRLKERFDSTGWPMLVQILEDKREESIHDTMKQRQ